jgi:hypothetical protein
MAQFLKVNAGAAGTGVTQTLIPIENIGAIASVVNAANVTTITIQMANFKTTGTYVITVPGVTGGAGGGATSASREKDAVEILNAALTANPGGVVSTLASVPALLQAPAAQSGQDGKILITQPATFAQYTTCTYTV